MGEWRLSRTAEGQVVGSAPLLGMGPAVLCPQGVSLLPSSAAVEPGLHPPQTPLHIFPAESTGLVTEGPVQ